MASSKSNWYVLALTMWGPKFVTEIGAGKTCKWENKKPLVVSRTMAESMSIGLIWNGTPAFPVCVSYELEGQPFCYDLGQFVWTKKHEEEETK